MKDDFRNEKLVRDLISRLVPYQSYRFPTLCSLMSDTCSKQELKQLLRSKEAAKYITKFKFNSRLWYQCEELNTPVTTSDKDDYNEITEKVLNDSKEYITKWIESSFEKQLSKCTEKFVEAEFKNEVLPVLMKHIDTKMQVIQQNIKGWVKQSIKESLMDAIDNM